MLVGCNYVPEGSTAFKVPGKIEFDRCELRQYEGTTAVGSAIRMKWYDTNTFITDKELAPGTYQLVARNNQNKGVYSGLVEVDGETQFYELTAKESEAVRKTNNRLSGSIKNYPKTDKPASLHVVFIGDSLYTRVAEVSPDGKWEVEAPKNAVFKLNLHMTGAKPLSYYHTGYINLEGNNVQIGAVPLSY